MNLPLLGLLALLGRIIGLGLERPWVKVLGQGRSSITATTITFGVELLILLPFVIWAYASGSLLEDVPRWIGYAAVSGVLYAIGFHSYVYGLSRGEVSYLTPLYATAFVWLYALDVIFGEAVLGWRPIAGILAVTLGIVFLNTTTSSGATSGFNLNPLLMLRHPGAWGMLTYAFCLATGRIIDSHGIEHAPVVAYAFAANTPAVMFGILWLAIKGRLPDLTGLLRERGKVAVLSGVVGIGAYLLLLVAMAQGIQPSVAEPVSQLSVFISIWLGGKWFGEPVSARWLPAVLVVVGAALLVL
ncbi:MAG: EamA family transporter [bacterium]|nr:EamA family transporter [bacterium]